jgi:hypothetical protein
MGASESQLSTFSTKEDYLNGSAKFNNDMVNWLESPGWHAFHNDAKVTLEAKPMTGHAIDAQKGTVLLTGSDFGKLTDKLFNPTFAERKKVYDEVISEKVLQTIDDNNIVVMTQFTAPWPVWPREFLVLKSRTMMDDGSMLITAQSIDYPTVPQTSGFIRGTIKTGMKVTQLDNNQIRVTKVEHVNPQGAIPTNIVKDKQRKNAFRLDAMQKYLDD